MSKRNVKKEKGSEFKIEALEPRYMMSADAPIDFSDDTTLGTQLSSVCSIIENSLNSEASSITGNVASTGLELRGNDDALYSSFHDLLGNVGSDIKTTIQNALSQAKIDAQNEIAAINAAHPNDPPVTSVSSSSFLSLLENRLPEFFTTEVSGSKITISYSLEKFLSLDEIGLNIDFLSNLQSIDSLKTMATISLALDLNSDNDGVALESDDVSVDSVSISDISASIVNLGGSAKFMNVNVEEQSLTTEQEPDLTLLHNSGNATSNFDLEFKGISNFDTFNFLDDKFIEVSRVGQGNISVVFPQVEMNSGYSLDALLNDLGGIDVAKLPFLRNYLNDFNISFNQRSYNLNQVCNIVENFNEYWARISLAMNGAFSSVDNILNFNKVKSFFSTLVGNKQTELSSLLETIKIYDINSNECDLLNLGSTGSLTQVLLSENSLQPTVFTLELNSNIGKIFDSLDAENLGLDFNILQLKDLDVNASMKIDVKVYSDNGTLKFSGIELNNFKVEISKAISASDTLNLGLFDAHVDGKFSYTIMLDSSGKTDASVQLLCNDILLKSGEINVYKKPENSEALTFNFNTIESAWEFPTDLKQYLALTGETLANNVAIYLNSLRTTLQSQISEKIKLNFLGDSAGSLVADSIARIDQILYGNKTENIDGLFVINEGALVANFKSVEQFKDVFNSAWKNTFFPNQDVSQINDVLNLNYYGMVEGGDEIICQYASLDDSAKALFVLDHYVLEFDLNFGFDKLIDLNFVDSFGVDFANVSTYGAASASGSAGIKFSLDVKFDYETLNDSTTLAKMWHLPTDEVLPENEKYLVGNLTSAILSGNVAKFDVVNSEKKVFDTVVVDNNSLQSAQIHSKENKIDCLFVNNQIVVECDEIFSLQSSENQQAYAELRLGNSSLQTTVVKSISLQDANDVKSWSQDLVLEVLSSDGQVSGSLTINQNALSSLNDILESEKTDKSQILNDLLNQYFNLQWGGADLKLVFSGNGLSIDKGRSIMNTFGIHVVGVSFDNINNAYSVRFGCDPLRIQGYGDKGLDVKAYEIQNGGTTTYMRVSETLKATGVIGSENGLMLERYSLDQDGDLLKTEDYICLDTAVFTSVIPDNLYDDATDAVDALNNELLRKHTIDGQEEFVHEYGDKFNVASYPRKNESGATVYSIGVSANNLSSFIYKVNDDGTLSKCKVQDGKLVIVKTVDVGYKASELYDSEKIDDVVEEIEDKLNTSFKDCFEIQTEKVLETDNYRIILISKYTTIYNSIFSNKFLTINASQLNNAFNSEVHVNTQNCLDVESLAKAINASFDEKSGVHSVIAQGNRIVLTVASNVVVQCVSSANTSGGISFSGDSFDFKVLDENGNIVGNPIDFEILNLNENSTVQEAVTAINGCLNSNNVALLYQDPDVNKVNREWDHLEFRSTTNFSLENIGSSKILEKFGFTATKATKYSDSDYRIVGKALLGVDWSKLIDFASGVDVEVSAEAELHVGQDFIVDSSSESDGCIILETKNNLDFIVNGLISVGGENYYKILDVVKEEQNPDSDNSVIVVKLKVCKFAEGAKDESDKILSTSTLTNFCYMGGAVASVGFVDLDLVASGYVGFDASFQIHKKTDSSNSLDYTVDASVSSKTDKDDESQKVGFSLASFVDIGDSISENIGSVVISLDDEGKLDVQNNSGLNQIVDNALNMFGNFSAEDLFTVLESLAKQIATIAEKSNVKIPVINKSVSDLVNVANDIRDVIGKMRVDKVSSLQGVNDRLNKYLKDFNLLALDGYENPFELSLIDIAGEKKLKYNINIDKVFDSVHQFSFGNGSYGISGNANLNVSGDFWFSLEGSVKIDAGSFDLILDGAIDFGASVKIVGEKLSFNLGLDNISDENLLANLITVGSNSDQSCVMASAILTGSFGAANNQNLSIDNLSKNGTISGDLAVKTYGVLPVSVANFGLGNILIGKCNGVDGVFAFDSSESAYTINITDGDYTPFEFEIIKHKTENENNYYESVENALVIDFSDVYTKIGELVNGSMGWFEKIKLAITGFNTLFDTLESQINNGMMSNVKDVPVVGKALSGGVDFLGDLKRKVVEPFSNFLYESTGLTAEMVAQKLNELFDGYFIADAISVDLRNNGGDSWTPTTGGGTYYRSNNQANYAEWYLNIGHNYSLGTDIGFDLGFPGLGLKSDAGVSLNLNWQLSFGFGVSKENGFYFIFNEGDEIYVDANVELSGEIMGSLAGLGLQMLLPGVGDENYIEKPVSLSFGVDLNSKTENEREYETSETNSLPIATYGANNVNVSAFSTNNIEFDYNASIDLFAQINVGVTKDLEKVGDAPRFPNIGGEFEFRWTNGQIEKLGFNDFELDMGTFISGVLGPIVSKIQKVVEPLEPLIGFLTTPFPVLDDLGFSYTPLSLAKEFSKGKFDDSMVYAIKDLIEISNKISAFGDNNLLISLGSMILVGGDGNDAAAEALLRGQTSKNALNNSLTDYLKDKNNGKDFSTISQDATSVLTSAGLNVGDSAWRFVWDNPTDVFKLLLGQDIMLVEYDMPKLSFNFDWSTFVRIYGPLGARLGLSLGADIDLGFGYDTLGIRQWVGSGCKDFGCLLNGFYVNDLRDGVDIDELSLHGGLTAAAELNAGVSAGVGGGVGINVGFNLFDPNKDGKIRLNEISQLFKEEGLFGFFDVNGAITAKLYAYVDLLFYTKEWNITGDKTLFKFDYEHTVKPVLISQSGDDVVANVGSNSSSRVATDKDNVSLEDIDEYLHLEINGTTVVDDNGHSGIVNGKLIINSEKGKDKIILESTGLAANFDIEINGGDGDDYIDLSKLNVAKGHYVLITGGAGNDTIIGAQGLNIIFGDSYVAPPKVEYENEEVKSVLAEANVDADRSGGDIILGGSGRDFIFGGAGDDQIDGGDGADFIFGDGGRIVYEKIEPNSEKWTIDRTDISLDGGKDTLIGGKGNDEIHGGGGDDRIDGGAGNDLIYGEKGHDRIMGGSGDDTIHGGEGMDIIFGDRIADSMDVAKPFAIDKTTDEKKKAAFSQEFIEAQFNGDTFVNVSDFTFDENALELLANKKGNLTDISNDEVAEEKKYGSDTIYGEDGNDLLFGDGGATAGAADEIYGGIGNDIIDGDGGNDTIKGGIDNDIIYGGAGDDTIDGGAGNDSMYGDEGVEAYDITDARELTRDSDDDDKEQDKLVFGDNLGLHGKIFANAQSNNNESGNDIILTGPGMDFVDGQGGSDTITVKLMGDSTTNYANVTDTGKDGSDVLFVEGTESVDTLLLRRNSDAEGNPGDLGLVALLPMTADDLSNSEGESTGASETVQNNLNSNIERVNYTQGIDVLNVNGNGGDDRFYIDGTAELTNVNGGAGNDSFQIGQLYNSERTDDAASARVQPVDAFHTEKTNEESYLSDGVSSDTTLNVEGGSGVDTFAALNNAGTLNMTAGKGDDIFSVYTFLKENGENFDRGAVLLDGGKGFDTLNVRGTDADDVLVVTKEGLLSDMVAIKAAGVESTQFDAAAGDDMFYVVGSKSTDVTELSGGKGNDTFSMGGLDTEYNLRSANTDGQSVDVKYEIVADANATTGDCVMTENFTVVDSDSQPAVFVVAKENGDAEAPYRIQASAEVVLGNENVDATFFIGCAGLAEGQTIDVTISAPMLSNADFNRGDCGFLIGTYDEESNAIVYATTRIVHFTANTVGNPIEVHVKACEDTLIEEGTCKAIAISSKLNSGVILSKSVTSVGLVFAGEARESAVSDFAARPLVATQEFTVGASSEFKLNMIPVPKKADGSQGDVEEEEVVETADVEREFTFYVNGEKQDWVIDTHYTLVDNVVKVSDSVFDTLSEGDKLVVSVRSNEMRVDDTRVALAYEDVLVSSVLVDGAEILPTATSGRYYELNGNVITFYDALTKRPTTIHGVVRVEADIPEEYDWETFGQGDVADVENQNESLLTVETHASVLAESGANSFTSVSYDVTYNKPIAEGETVYVKITPAKLLANSGAEEDSQRLSIACNDFTTQEDGSIVVSFNSSTLTRSLTITTVSDGEQDEYGLTKAQKQSKVINEIDGPVYAYGFGKSIDLNAGDPAMLKYKHVIETKDGVRQASNFNELNNFAEDKLYSFSVGDDGHLFIDLISISDEQKAAFGAIGVQWDAEMSQEAFLAQFEGKTFKWVVTTTKDVGTASDAVVEKETSVAAEWSRIKEARSFVNGVLELVLDEAVVLPSVGEKFALISGNRDSLFVDEMASVDRLFVNNQQDSVDARASLTGFVNNNRNEAEKNVDAYDSHAVRFTHTELEAFPEKQLAANDDPLMMQSGITAAQMEYAEYNLGKGKDTVDINKTLYREDAYRTYTVVNAGDAKDRDAAFGISIGKAEISSDNLTNGANYITDSNVYKYDLIPAEGSEISVIKTSANTTVYYVQAEIRKLNSESESGYDVVGIQRREVLGSFSSAMGFHVKYDFILAEGEYIGEFEFFQAEFDDYIRVNSYKADAPFVDENDSTKNGFICSGVIAEVAPVQEETGDDNAETGDEPVAGEEDVEGDDEETTPAEEVAGFAYSYAMAESDAAEFENRMASFQAWQSGLTSAANGYVYGIFVDATMSDGSVQRRFVTELTANTFKISRDFTLSEGLKIVSLCFAYRYEGDGQLVINAQSGHDRIDASSTNVTRNDMVAFGGLGDDYITMNKGGIAFGDRGQVLYDNGQVNGVDVGDTVLGSTVNNIDAENPAFIDDYTTGIGKTPGRTTDEKGNPVHRLQTDGVNRDAYRIQSVDAENGGTDMIKVGGTNSVVVGGAENDVIVIGGDKNVALGDNGRVKYNNAGNDDAVYGDKLGLGMHIVETTNDSIGGVDNIVIAGDKNVAMGGAEGDSIRITGADNVAIGDGGRYTIEETRLYAESKSEQHGGQDFISTGDGKNAVIGGTDNDVIRTGAGNDAIVGDGGKVIMDTDRNALMVSNEGYNVGTDLGTAGADDIDAGNGDNVVFGGLDGDDIRTGTGKDVVFGDNGFATFRGNAAEAEEQVTDTQSIPETRTEATLSFNFMGASQTGLSSEDVAGAADFAKSHWNNVGGSLAGTYGNDDREIVRFDDNTRASAVSVSYGGIESHRNTSTDNRINLQAYGHNLPNASTDADAALMNSGYMTTAPGNQCDNKLEVAVDGLAQYFTDYHVAVYLDMPDANSWEGQSIRKVSLYVGDSTVALQSFYVNDCAGSNFNGTYRRSEYTSAEDILADLAHNAAVLSGELTGDDAVLIDTTGNYVVFEVPAGVAADNFRVIIEDGYTLDNINGKDIPGIAAIQVKGTLHAQDVAASTDIAHGGADTVYTSGGDDIVVGGTGGDTLTTYGDERYGIYDNDVVFGDNAKIVFTDRDSSEASASTLSLAESLDSRTVAGDYNDHIYTGDGNDVVVGGQGADHIESGATAAAETMLDGIQVASFNFTRENATASEIVAPGDYIPVLDENNQPVYENDKQVFDFIPHETAGVVADNDWTNLYIKNNGLHVVGENYTNDPVTHDGIGISLVAYDTAVGDGTQNSSLMPKDDAQLDGDTSNSKLFNAYYAAQQQQEIKLTLTNLDSFADGAPCDVYVYLGGDQQNTDTYNYLFDVCGHQVGGDTPDQHYYLNDWTGSHFDGDYRLVECATAPTADELLSQVAPDMRLIGNYVVFHGVSSATFEVRIRNLFTDTNQWPLNLPVITAVQVVAGENREEDIAVGGDHDKDLVFGDDARVTFDIDTPFARNENLADYANRAIEAESMHFDGAAVEIPLDENDEPVETGDTILTGKDRDVIVGGDFGDTITMGDGDDVALGDNASLILEHNNPVGVFAPSVEIMLEQHTVTTSTPEVFLGNNDADADDIQDKFENGGVPGVTPETSENGATDTFTDTTDKDWTIQQEVTPGTISQTIDISSGAQVVNFAEGETVLLVSDTWPGNQWWHPNIVMVADGQGHSVPALEWEWDVNGTTMTATTQPGYYFTVDIPDTPNEDNRYEIRVTALAAGTAVISIGA